MNSKILWLCVFPLIIPACTPTGEKDSHPEPDPDAIEITGTLSNSCPLAVVCDEKFAYHAYAGKVGNLSIYFSFKPGFVLDRKPGAAQGHFNYMYFSYHHPSLQTDSSTFYREIQAIWGTPYDSEGVYHRIDSFSGDTLRGTIQAFFPHLTERIETKRTDCVAGDVAGICYRGHALPAFVSIRYAFRLQD